MKSKSMRKSQSQSLHQSSSRRTLQLALVTMAALPLLASAQNTSAPGQQNAQVTAAVYHDHSPNLRGVMPLPDAYYSGTGKVHDVKHIPHIDSPGFTVDAAAQTTAISSAAATTAGLGFDGVGNGFTGPGGAFTVNSAPPDTTGAVGATQ